MTDSTLFGINPAAFHLTNVWLHIANTALVFYFLKRATGAAGRSLAVACLFAWHPINVETVAWIAERKGLLGMTFALLALIAYLRYAEKPSRGRMCIVALALVMSLLCKSVAVVLPALFLVLDYWPLRRLSAGRRSLVRKLFVEKIPLFCLSLIFVLLTIKAESNLGAVRSMEQFSLGDRMLNSVAAVPLYLKHLLVPNQFTPYYPIRVWSSYELVLFITVCVLLMWLAARSLRRREPIAAGIFWFLICLSPVLGFIKIGTHLMADRYAYLPQIGIFVALVWLVAGVSWLKPSGHVALFGVVSGILIFLTHRQLPAWKNDLTLALNGERVTGKNAIVCYGLGVGYERIGNRELSLRCFREVMGHYIDYAGTQYNIARACVFSGNSRRAQVHLERALHQAPDEPRYHNLLAEVLCASSDSKIRNGSKALEHASLACQLSQNRSSLYLDTLAAAYAETGQFKDAVIAATGAMRLAPTEEVREIIGERIRLYAAGKPYRGILLHDAPNRGSPP